MALASDGVRTEHRLLADRLVARLEGENTTGHSAGEVSVDRYLSQARFDLEHRSLFARLPTAVASESEVATPGACVAVDVAGISVLLVRGNDGELRAFRNACRHRSMPLIPEDSAPCQKKAFVCPYHGWTYDLAGGLIHVPHVATFDRREQSRSTLAKIHVEARAGLVWAALEPFDAAAHLGPLDEELGQLDLERSVSFRRSVREVRGNWKLIVEGFLESYHVRHLHRDTVYPFFVDSLADTERAGLHVRGGIARRALRDAFTAGSWDPRSLDRLRFRDLITMVYLVFPSTVVVVSPEYVQVLRAIPTAPDRTRFEDLMLVPKGPMTEAERERMDRSFTLIDENVFQAEDLATVEATQRALRSGANETLVFGALECGARLFNESVDEALERAAAAPRA